MCTATNRPMQWLQIDIAGNEAWRWLLAAATLLVTVLGVRVAIAVVHRRVENAAQRTRTRADDVVIGVLERTKWFFYVGLGIFLGTRLLELPRETERGIMIGATLVLLLQVGVWGNRAIKLSTNVWREKHAARSGDATIATGIAFVAQLVMWTIVVLMALSNMGVEITALVAGLGMGGIAAALAVQNILGDLFAALSIYFDRPFDIGDVIQVADQEQGTVERIGLRSTRLRGLGGEQLVYSNRDLTANRIKNYRRMKERRVVTTIALDREADVEQIERAIALLREIVEEVPNLRFERAHFVKFGANALEIELAYWVLDRSVEALYEGQQAVNFAILRRFGDEAIALAMPAPPVVLGEGARPPRARASAGSMR